MSEQTDVKKRRPFLQETNPLLLKELRGRMRGARAFVVLSLYLLVLSCIASVVYYVYTASSGGMGGGPDLAYLGKTFFGTVVIIEILMTLFITPAFTAGAISGERERKTYEVLRTTLLSARQVVFGKLGSALMYIFLLILVAVPMQSLAFLFGGVTVGEFAVALVLLTVSAMTFAVIGLFFSSLVQKTLVATVLTYAAILVLSLALPAVLLLLAGLGGSYLYTLDNMEPSSSAIPPWIWEAALMYGAILLASLSPLSTAILTETFLEQYDTLFFHWEEVGHMFVSYGPSMPAPPATQSIPILSPWILMVAIYLALAALLLFLTVRRVRRRAAE